MTEFAAWKAAVTKLLKEPKAANVDHKHWRNAYIKSMSPDDAAAEIDRIWYNANRPKMKRTPSKADLRKARRARQ